MVMTTVSSMARPIVGYYIHCNNTSHMQRAQAWRRNEGVIIGHRSAGYSDGRVGHCQEAAEDAGESGRNR